MPCFRRAGACFGIFTKWEKWCESTIALRPIKKGALRCSSGGIFAGEFPAFSRAENHRAAGGIAAGNFRCSRRTNRAARNGIAAGVRMSTSAAAENHRAAFAGRFARRLPARQFAGAGVRQCRAKLPAAAFVYRRGKSPGAFAAFRPAARRQGGCFRTDAGDIPARRELRGAKRRGIRARGGGVQPPCNIAFCKIFSAVR